MSAGNASDYPKGAVICLDSTLSSRTDVDIVRHTQNSLEAIRLVQLGARAPLVSRLTGLDKKVVNHFYRQFTGRHSPPGQAPFTDTWYLQNNQRMLHVNVVWRLYQHLLQWKRSTARLLIDVYENYLNFVRTPVLDLTRTFFVSHLVTVQAWYEQICDDCAMAYIAPLDSRRGDCPICSHYFSFRCRGCGSALHNYPRGRQRTFCTQCREHRAVMMLKSDTTDDCTGC